MTPVVGVGAGGHAKVVIDILRQHARYDIVGLTDPDATLWHACVLDVPVLGDDRILPSLLERGVRAAFLGVGSVGDSRTRRRLYEHVVSLGFDLLTAIHPRAIVASSVELGRGAIVMAGAVINAGARLGENVVVNSGAVVEHDCVLGAHVHVATGAALGGAVRVGDGAHVGIGASVRQGITIGVGAIVGAGAVVVRDVPAGATVASVAARPLRRTAGA